MRLKRLKRLLPSSLIGPQAAHSATFSVCCLGWGGLDPSEQSKVKKMAGLELRAS